MEKRRRARINQCLQELKDLILEALNKDPARHNKLEKADILEMAVRHLRTVHRQQLQLPSNPPENTVKYRAGFTECANEVSRFVNSGDHLQPDVKHKLIGHLSSCINTLDTPPISQSLNYPQSPSSQPEHHDRTTPPPLAYSPFPPMSPSSHRSSPPMIPAQLVAFPGMLPPPTDLNNNGNLVNNNYLNNVNGYQSPSIPLDATDEEDAPLDFSKKPMDDLVQPVLPTRTFPNPRKKYLASVSSSSGSIDDHLSQFGPPELELHSQEPVNFSKNVYGGALAPRFSYDSDLVSDEEEERRYVEEEDDDMWRPW